VGERVEFGSDPIRYPHYKNQFAINKFAYGIAGYPAAPYKGSRVNPKAGAQHRNRCHDLNLTILQGQLRQYRLQLWRGQCLCEQAS